MASTFEFIAEVKANVDSIMGAKVTTQKVTSIPDPAKIPLEGTHWLSVDDVTCVYADMVGSTRLQIGKSPIDTARAHQIFVDSLVRTFNQFNAEYIDIKGDGAFGIFIGKSSPVVGLCAAVTFKTICGKILKNKIPGFSLETHLGIDFKNVLLKRVGLRGEKQNEVWAGKPVNMAAKLSSLSAPDTVLVSDRVYNVVSKTPFHQKAVMSCGCPSGTSTTLWGSKDLTGIGYFDFTTAYSLKSNWCDTHGEDVCQDLLSAAAKNN